MMDAEHAYMAAFLITGSHVDAAIARDKVRKQLAACPICGDGIEDGDAITQYDGRYAHEECVVAGEPVTCEDCGLW